MKESIKTGVIIIQSMVIITIVLIGNYVFSYLPRYDQTSDYAIELQKDGTVYVKTDHGLDTTLVTLDSLKAFITADNL